MKYRKVDTRIWNDQKFRALSTKEKMETIRQIVFNDPPELFKRYAGPSFQETDQPK